jgi:hypothetical protein
VTRFVKFYRFIGFPLLSRWSRQLPLLKPNQGTEEGRMVTPVTSASLAVLVANNIRLFSHVILSHIYNSGVKLRLSVCWSLFLLLILPLSLHSAVALWFGVFIRLFIQGIIQGVYSETPCFFFRYSQEVKNRYDIFLQTWVIQKVDFNFKNQYTLTWAPLVRPDSGPCGSLHFRQEF